MSTRPSDLRAESRTEARRRARLAARGELPSDEPGPPEPPSPRRGGFLERLFPSAPPLPNRPDPLAGFDRSGPLRPVRERLFLLRRNPLAWGIPAVVAFMGHFASIFYAGGVMELVATFVLFGALIAAGWFGWQRPALFGTTAGLLSYLLAAGFVLLFFAQLGVSPITFGSPGQVIGGLALQAAYQGGLGFLGGWYGGYLRRRQTQLSAEAKRRR